MQCYLGSGSAVLDWMALLTGRLWLVTYVRHYRKLFKIEGEPEGYLELVTKVVTGGYAVRDH
jgi:hypothetical protein